jgi:hypothetical protein
MTDILSRFTSKLLEARQFQRLLCSHPLEGVKLKHSQYHIFDFFIAVSEIALEAFLFDSDLGDYCLSMWAF